MGKMKYKCIFNADWLNSTIFADWHSWLRPVSNDSGRAFCVTCKKSFDISNMGKAAIRSHAGGQTHVNNVKRVTSNNSQSFVNFFGTKVSCNSTFPSSSSQSSPIITLSTSAAPSQSSSNVTSNSTTQVSSNATFSTDFSNLPSCSTKQSSNLSSSPTTENKCSKTNAQANLINHVTKQETIKAEIIWALDSIKKHRSFHSSDDQGKIFAAMFPDSTIAKQYRMAEDKLAYVTTFGLSPHFQQQSVMRISSASEFTISFDEAHNTVVQKGQLDVWVRYFDDSKGCVCSEYLTSVFMGHSRASNLLESIKEATAGLDLRKLIQISMDGPAVNLSFYRQFTEDFKENYGRSLLDTGICSLHVVSGALQHGHKKAGWNVNGILRGMHQVFKDSPARRADFIKITGCNTFPKSFCKIRWTENKACCERAVLVLPHVKKYCAEIKPKPSTHSFEVVEEATRRDDFCLAKIEFFKAVAGDFEPFLRRFQNDKPMFPFLYSFLFNLSHDVLKRYVTAPVLDQFSSQFSKMKQINVKDINSEHLKQATQVDIGFGAKNATRQKEDPRKKLEFYVACKSFLIGVTEKLFERSPLNYSIIRGASALAPDIITGKSSDVCQKRFDTLVQMMFDSGQITTSHADDSKREYVQFINSFTIRKHLNEFSLDNDRLDTLYVQLMKNESCYQHLWTIAKKVFILFHGQAAVEGGFSINKDILVENLHEISVVAQRVVYNAIQFHNGVLNVPITDKLFQSVRASSNRRQLALSTAHEKFVADHALQKRKNELDQELKSIECEKAKLSEQRQDLDERAAAIKRVKLAL